MKFTINIAQFLDFKTAVPDLYYVIVEHIEGNVVAIELSPAMLRHIKDIDALLKHLDAAAINNYSSLKQPA